MEDVEAMCSDLKLVLFVVIATLCNGRAVSILMELPQVGPIESIY